MSDPYNGPSGSDPQTVRNTTKIKARKFGVPDPSKLGSSKEKGSKKPQHNVHSLYVGGVKILEAMDFHIELSESGDHVKHRILTKKQPPPVKGIKYPNYFSPLQDISTADDLNRIEDAFNNAPEDIRTFWEPLYRPKSGDTNLLMYAERKLALEQKQRKKQFHEPLDYAHTFDPDGALEGNGRVPQPRIWVPAREWFNPAVRSVKLEDVFTIFPPAELELLRLIIGRIGVGRSNHVPPNFPDPIDHTARMAAVIVGKDAGLGKSTIFNGMNAAFAKCGFETHTFKSTEDRFGLKQAALSDIAYKDDTAMKSLKAFLSAEETKILITNGQFQTEEKFQHAEQIWPKCVCIVNSNDWDAHFAYDLDPGIIDRIKVLSTYREYEVRQNRLKLTNEASEGTPDLRPKIHIPYLAEKLGVSAECLFLWCLRLATDHFWKVITDDSDPTINRLQVEVRQWTTRTRIRFKSDTTQALINAMAMSSAIRNGDHPYFMPELTPEVLKNHLEDLQFIGLDKSTKHLMTKMKQDWEAAGRPSTHYYQGFREIRWESIALAIGAFANGQSQFGKTAQEYIKDIMTKLVMRDGFRISTTLTYVNEPWVNTRHAMGDIQEKADELRATLSETQRARLCNRKLDPTTGWIKNPDYSPDRAEEFRPDMV